MRGAALISVTCAVLVGAAGSAEAAPTRPALNDAELRGASAAALDRDVAAAILANRRLAIEVLWTDFVPPSAVDSTRGPALAALRVSARARQLQHLRMRMVNETWRIATVDVNPAGSAADAIVDWNQDIAPSDLDGHSIGHTIELRERARLILHRVGSSTRFVVWEISLLG
jgi:hypothetical protein